MRNPKALRLLNQQLVSPQFKTPEEVVSHMGAIQAQDYRMVRWAVEMRTKSPSHEAFRRAYDGGRIIRTHLLRCTWQLVSAEDYRWMMELCAPKALSVMKGWMHSNGIDIAAEESGRIRDIILPEISGRSDMTSDDIEAILERRGIVMDHHRLSYHIRLAELDGLLCSGDLHPRKATYSLASEKVGVRASMDRDEALALLARKYFQSHSPATLEDFVWWSGLGAGDCRRAISLLRDELRCEKWRGRDFHVLESCRTRGSHKGSLILLPPYDEYLIAYKSRDVSLAPEHSHHAHNNSGIFYPVVLDDGVVCGNWKTTGASLSYTLFPGVGTSSGAGVLSGSESLSGHGGLPGADSLSGAGSLYGADHFSDAESLSVAAVMEDGLQKEWLRFRRVVSGRGGDV